MSSRRSYLARENFWLATTLHSRRMPLCQLISAWWTAVSQGQQAATRRSTWSEVLRFRSTRMRSRSSRAFFSREIRRSTRFKQAWTPLKINSLRVESSSLLFRKREIFLASNLNKSCKSSRRESFTRTSWENSMEETTPALRWMWTKVREAQTLTLCLDHPGPAFWRSIKLR